MERNRGIILLLVIIGAITVTFLPCSADENSKDDNSIWTEGERRVSRPGYGMGRGRFEPTEEEIDRILKELKKRDPEKANELTKLRDKAPEKFIEELRRQAREEFGSVIKARIDSARQKRQADFIEWLRKSVPDEAEELDKLREKNPELYTKKYELAWRKYGRTFDESRRSPELAEVLIEDLHLQKRRDELRAKIKAARSEKEKSKLIAQLEEVVSDRYDLLVRRKQIAYERLLKWLEELRSRIRESRAELEKAQDRNIKAENVKKRTQELVEGSSKFNWD